MKGTRANPAGRPRRGTSEATRLARALLDANAPELTQLAIDQAREGNPIALKLCLERLMPVMLDRTVKIQLPTVSKTPNDILSAHNAVLKAVAAGDLSPQEGQNVSQIIEARRRSWESVHLSTRIADLEDQAREQAGRRR